VYPSLLGQDVRPLGGVGVVLGGAVVGGGCVIVGAGAVVGGGAGAVTPGLVADGIATTVLVFPFGERRIAATAPRPARTRKTSTGQTQSPGYQPRRAHAAAAPEKIPVRAGKRSPHSRQYSCPAA
jgi:hypothetical protein